MPVNHRTSRVALATLMLALVPMDAVALTDAEIACRDTIAKTLVKYVNSVLKTTAKCHRSRNKGKLALSVDCSDVAQADTKGKLAGKRADLVADVTGACSLAPSLLAEYPRCPSPAAASDDGEATSGIDSFSELGACLVGLADDLGGAASAEVMGRPPGLPDIVVAKCQSALAKGTTKLMRTYGREGAACQHARDVDGLGPAFGCTGADPKGKIGKARSKLLAAIDSTCAFPDPVSTTGGNERLDVLNACGDTIDQLETCVADVVAERLGTGLIGIAYGLPASCSVDRLVRTTHAGFGSRLTKTRLSAGWNGLAHGIDFNDGFSDVMDLACDDDCANCALSINPAKGTARSFCRCASNASLSCDVINGPDPDDCAGLNNTCQCFFGPPLGASAAGNPACIPIKITTDYSGTVDVGKGAWENPIQVAAAVHLGLDAKQPCPVCSGDITPNDGVRDGTCSAGARQNQPCDVNGVHPTFGIVSMDCQPQNLTNISGGGLLLNFSLISADQSLPFTLPCDTAPYLCPCRVCANDTSIGCRNDAECPGTTGPCTGGGGAGVQPNGCSDRVCSLDGECSAGPVDRFCDGTVHPNGDGFLTCSTDLDCSLNGNGACTIEQPRRCYPDPIEVSGAPGVFGADVGGLACIGLTTSAVINIASGLPSAVKVALETSSELSCAGDPSTPWYPPSGVNCVTTTSTTTTTLFPPLPCVAALPPGCGGTCPPGQVCASNGLACGCEAVTTTTLPPAGCAELAFPLCSGGTCPPGSTCQIDLLGGTCACTAGTACADTLFPICGGTCPLGQACQGSTLGQPCACG